MAQKGGAIQRIFERQSGQIFSCPSSRWDSQQRHWEGRKNWKSLSRNGCIHLKLPAHRAELSGHAVANRNVSQGNFILIVPLPVCRQAGTPRGTCRSTSEWDLHRIQSEGVFFRREIGREVDELLTLVNRVSAPLMALRTIRSPFF
jgi:hypothetical protein